MTFDTAIVALCAITFAPSTVWLFKMWFYELRFYRDRNWNFAIDSEYSGMMKWGDAAPIDEGMAVGNRARVCFWLPFMAFGFLASTIFCLLVLTNGWQPI